MDGIRAIIVDDEIHARKKLRALLEGSRGVEVVGEYDNGADAVSAIEAGGVDLVFLDVQMPGMSGLDVVRSISPESMPMVVFATAYDRFAVEAFEAHAVDYLLKPIDPERISRTLDYARERLSARTAGDAARRLERLLDTLGGAHSYARRFAIKSGGTIHVLDVDDIDWIEADGNYVTFHAAGKTYLDRETLSGVERRLDPARFVRIHRSRIVCVDRVRALKPDRHGDFTVIMKDGTELTLTRTHRARLLERFEADT
jgi:two-component system LytT family response regulator